MSTPYLTKSHRNFTVNIVFDENAVSPREWSPVGQFFTNSPNRFDPDNLTVDSLPADDNGNHTAAVIKNEYIFIPFFVLDHSGFRVSWTSFNDAWDSWRSGVYAVRKNNKEIKNMSEDEVVKLLRDEIDEFDTYLCGEVYGYEILDKDGSDLGACWGYLGNDSINVALADAYTMIDSIISEREKKAVDFWSDVDRD